MNFTQVRINFIEEVETQEATPGRESVKYEAIEAVKTICSCLIPSLCNFGCLRRYMHQAA